MEGSFPISIEKFISLVKKKALIWDKSLDDYKNKIATQNAWKQILLIMYPDFETWNEKKRQEYAKKTIKKWTYIRDTFLRSEKKIEGQKLSGSGAKTAKPYVYHKQLSFIIKNTQPNISVSIPILKATNERDSDNDDSADDGVSSNEDEGDTVDAGPSFIKYSDFSIQNKNKPQAQPAKSKTPMRKRLSSQNLSHVDAKMIKFMDSYSSQVRPINRHNSFFNGLIPTLEKFNDDQVIDFQLGVINLIKKIKHTSTVIQQPHTSSSSP